MASLEATVCTPDEENTAIDEKKITFRRIADSFDTISEVTKAIKNVGLEDCGLIFGW